MNRQEIIANAKLKLNYNSTQTDVDFQDADFVSGLQEVYVSECNIALDTALFNHFKRYVDFTWSANEVTKEIPDQIKGKIIIELSDVTSSSIGEVFEFGERDGYGYLFWKDKSTLQWGTTGPSTDTTVRAVYVEIPEQLQTDTSVPALIPSQFHYLLTWSLAVYMKELAEEVAPAEWKEKLIEQRRQLYRFLEKGKPMSDPPAIRPLHLTTGGFGT